MYRVWPLLLTSTVPTPGTFFAATVAVDEDVPAAPGEALAAAAAPPALPAALGLEPEPDAEVPAEAPQAATAIAAPKITLPPSSRREVEPEWGRTVMPTRETPFEVSQSFKLFPLVTGFGPRGIAVHRWRSRRTTGALFGAPGLRRGEA